MRTLKTLSDEAQTQMQEGQKLFKQKGMKRSAVALSSAMQTLRFKRIAQETGIYEWERYIDAKTHSDWEKIGENWVVRGVDPDA